MAEIDEAVVDLIDAAVGSLTKGTNLCVGPLLPAGGQVPGVACFALMLDGPPPDVYTGPSQTDLKEIPIQIWYRGAKGQYEAGKAVAKSIRLAVHKKSPVGGIANSSMAQQSEPLYVGEDKQGLPMWTINITVRKSET